ncbi:MAG: impB/mucB/samB family protein [Micavibrio sp.]|nr:impB/mucB/samB family protein [Micavibrio sp.]|tara:strand:+ start:521562 stop:522851 length:1290 start_codon:yes stop_codon:yes gene_type:complete
MNIYNTNIQDDEDTVQWLFLDLNSYFASVEQQMNPHLRGKPVVVVPTMTDATCAIAASYEAKAYGVKTGTKIYDAKKMCPDLICVPACHEKYVTFHHRIIDEIILHTPINKIWSIDELSSRLPPNKRPVESAIALCERIKEGLAKNVGPAITCSIGLAPNSFLAKVATDMEKPDGLVILRRCDLPGRLFDLKLSDLPGIGKNMEARLFRAGITTVEKLWNISPKHARKIWGSVSGERFWYNLHGFDVPDQKTSRSMIGHSRVLDPDLRESDKARLIARRLLLKALARLRRESFYAQSFRLGVKSIDGQKWAYEITCNPSQDNFFFIKTLDELWELMEITFRKSKFIKVSVIFGRLAQAGECTGDLFEACDTKAQEEQAKNSLLTFAMDHINKRYGAETVKLGFPPKTLAEDVGTKIAFSRIPDKAEFNE